MAKEKTRCLKLILSYQLGLNKSLLCSGLDLDGNDGTEKLNVSFICSYVNVTFFQSEQLLCTKHEKTRIVSNYLLSNSMDGKASI